MTAAPQPRRRSRVRPAVAAALATVAASWWFVLSRGQGAASPFAAESWRRAGEFAQRLLGVGAEQTPAYADTSQWLAVLELAAETLAMSVLAAGIAGVAALVTVVFASSSLTTGALAVAPRPLGRAVLVLTRGLHLLTRAVPELIWALLIVFVLKPGLFAGALALALHNFGVLGRLGADVVDDLPPGPLRALRSNGAGNVQLLAYGVLPQVLPQFLTFLLYRWEVIIRASAVVGFVTAAGLGYALRLDLSFFRYTEVALVLLVYVALVWAVDIASTLLRRLAR